MRRVVKFVLISQVRFKTSVINVVAAHDQLGKFWETVVLKMIGETLDDGDNICGARILDKVWFSGRRGLFLE